VHTWYVHTRLYMCIASPSLVPRLSSFEPVGETTGKNGAANGRKNGRENGRLRDCR